MIRLALELILAPALVGGSTLACRRWSDRIGGLLSAFPAVVGPVLLITAQEQGNAFTARAATATLLGLIALAGFVLVYAWVATRAGWGASLLAGWSCAGLIAALLVLVSDHATLAAGLIGAALSLAGAYRAMPSPSGESVASAPVDASQDNVPLRMTATAVLVAALAAAAQLLGPVIGGVLAGLPVLASVLAVFTHRRKGSRALLALLRGMIAGMTGFVGFCAVVSLLIVPAGIALAFAAATSAAAGLQALALREPWSRGHRLPAVSPPA